MICSWTPRGIDCSRPVSSPIVETKGNLHAVGGNRMHKFMIFSIAVLSSLSIVSAPAKAQTKGLPERVMFPSADGRTTLVGYLYRPLRSAAPAPAIVMMHGRSGAYSSKADGIYDASTLSKRHKAWEDLIGREPELPEHLKPEAADAVGHGRCTMIALLPDREGAQS